MKKFLIIIFLLLSLYASASHIVGGEFEMIHIQGFQYRLRMILYFDVLYGNPGALDEEANVSFFKRAGNELIENVTLPIISIERVDYTQQHCNITEIVTNRIVYEVDVFLDPSKYNHPLGYYMVWQRCCRNYGLTNIESYPPDQGTHAGQTFYLEFPAIVDDEGLPFVNSSPIDFPPLREYSCPYQPYYVNFAGHDPDGDSLVYSMVDPLSTQFLSALPPQGQNLSAPYPMVTYRPSYGLFNIANGNPDLSISKKGLLTITPTYLGLYVFAIKVEEYRNGLKIGEVRRDFQMLILDKCPKAEQPKVEGRKKGETDFMLKNLEVTFQYGISADDRCLELQISDPDALKFDDDSTEVVRFEVFPLNFEGNLLEVLPEITSDTLRKNETANFEICFPECPYLQYEPYEIGILAYDDACPLPMIDTLIVKVNVEPPPNQKPFIESPSNNYQMVRDHVLGGLDSVDIVGKDADNDSIYFLAFPFDFNPEDYGFTYKMVSNQPGEVRYRIIWNYDCLETHFDTKTIFPWMIILDDIDQCLFEHPDTVMINFQVNLPPNTFPEIESSDLGDPSEKYFYLERKVNETISFNTLSTDLDNDSIFLEMTGANFDPSDFAISFEEKRGKGAQGLESPFFWDLTCDDFKDIEQDSFRFYLMVEDIDFCNETSRDTLTVDLKLEPVPNDTPRVIFTSLNSNLTIDMDSGHVKVNHPLELEVRVLDLNQDFIELDLIRVIPDNGITDKIHFESVSGTTEIASVLSLTPTCDIVDPESLDGTFKLIFEIRDNDCLDPIIVEKKFTLTVNDFISEPLGIPPPNVFTPNGDELNEFFALEGIDGKGEPYSLLPVDNCIDFFEEVTIVNRWGRRVFQARARDFKWDGGNQPTGTYFYHVKFSVSEFKGTITLIK